MLHIRLLGKTEITVEDAPTPTFRGKSGLWLVGLLTLHANRPAQRDWLAGTLWPDSAPEQGRANLRRALTDVRQALGEIAVRLTTPSPHTLLLQLSENEADVLAFRAGDISRYGGELMPGCSLEWVENERRVLEEAYLAQGEKRAELLAPEAALPLLEKLRACAPLRESLVRLQLTVLCRLGNRAEAQQVYYDFRRLLLEKRLGEPSSQTQEAWKNLQSVQVAASDGSASPALFSSAALPAPLTPCLGRERELDALTHLLQKHRLITLTGLGGVGKTRLAIECARRYNRALFLELAEWQNSQPLSETLQTLLQTLPPPRDANEPTLLVLDNFEQLVGPEANRAVRTQLEANPQVRFLITSRRVLGCIGEQTFPLEPLDLPQHPGSPERLQDFASVQLFVERARAARPSFALTSENAACVVALCRQAEGIPLALELLAAHLRGVLPDDLLAQVTQFRLPLLSRQKTGELPRHQSLWRIVESSVALLTEAERTGFWQMCVFRGGWSLEAARAVCAGGSASPDPLKTIFLLESLTDNSLVRFAGGRYGMLETLREWGLATQPDALCAQARRDHATFFLALAEKHGATPEGFDLLDREPDNLQAAFDFLLDADLPSAQRFARALRPFWFHRRIGRRYGERLLNHLNGDRLEVRAQRAETEEMLGALCAMSGDFDAAHVYLQNALRYFRETGETVSQAKILANLAGIAIEQGEYERAGTALTEALPFWRAANQPRGLAVALANLGIVRTNQGDLNAAEPLIREALRLRIRLGDSYGIATCLVNRGAIELRRAASDDAEATYRDALMRFQQIGDRRGEATCLEGLVEVFLNRNEPTEALRHLREMAWLRHEFHLPESALQTALYQRIRRVLGEAVYNSLFIPVV